MRRCRHPLVVTLANTREVLYLANRSGNRPSHENAAVYFDRSIDLCRRAGFRRVLLRTHGVFVARRCSDQRCRTARKAFTTINLWLRGDTDFSQTTQLDRWDADNVEFVFGMDAMKNLVELAENLPDSAWRELTRSPKTTRKTSQTRAKRPHFKEQFVIEKEYKNKRQENEFVAEFDYQPTACDRAYRIVVLRSR